MARCYGKGDRRARGGKLTAYDELNRTGEVGAECYAIFIAKAHREVRGYPTPDGHLEWKRDDVEELVQRVFAAKGTTITLAVLGCANQDRLEALVTAIVQNYLKDEAKSTEVGKLRRRLSGLLAQDPRFAEGPPEWWYLAGQSSATTRIDRDNLMRAALDARDVVLELPLNRAGRASARNLAGLTAVSAAVLTAAGGAIPAQDLAYAVAARCDLLVTPPLPWTDSDINRLVALGTDDDADVRSMAREIVIRLDKRERRAVLRMAGVPVGVHGVGPKQLVAVRERVAALIQQITGEGDEREKVIKEVVTLLSPRPDRPPTITSSDPDEVADATPSTGEVAP